MPLAEPLGLIRTHRILLLTLPKTPTSLFLVNTHSTPLIIPHCAPFSLINANRSTKNSTMRNLMRFTLVPRDMMPFVSHKPLMVDQRNDWFMPLSSFPYLCPLIPLTDPAIYSQTPTRLKLRPVVTGRNFMPANYGKTLVINKICQGGPSSCFC